MDLWQEQIEYVREDFISRLVGRGMTLIAENSHKGPRDCTLQGDRVTVTLGSGFPYAPPEVRLKGEPRLVSWHVETNGKMCLYTSSERSHQPWRDVGAFLERIEAWFENSDAGWPGDVPVLDIETYLDLPLDHRFLTYRGLHGLADGYVRLKSDGRKIHFLGPGKVAKNTKKGLLNGYLTTLGTLETPPRTWEDLLSISPAREVLLNAFHRGRLDVLLMRYSRQEQHGVLSVALNDNGEGPQPHRLLSASADPTTMGIRAGRESSVLQGKSVCLVGGGALGSHISDALIRAGLGELTIRDFDILTPGNLTRHVITDPESCGDFKADALKRDLKSRPYCRGEVWSVATALTDPFEAIDMIEKFDLVVDATADGGVTLMLEHAAAAVGKPIVTACLQNEGTTHRVDIVPPLAGETPLPSTTNRPLTAPLTFEAGCGEPISATPPHAVAEAAAMATRHIIGMLTGHPVSPNGEVRDFG